MLNYGAPLVESGRCALPAITSGIESNRRRGFPDWSACRGAAARSKIMGCAQIGMAARYRRSIPLRAGMDTHKMMPPRLQARQHHLSTVSVPDAL